MATELCSLPFLELQGLLKRRAISPTEVVRSSLARIERMEPTIRAFTHLDPDAALRDANDLEHQYRGSDDLPPLYGIPIPIKDLIAVRGVPLTRGSKIFQNFIPEEDAPAVARLRRAGAVILGKTQTSEFGWKAATANPLFPETRNPTNPAYTAGGSSGGSAAAVAAGYCPIAIGTDAAGSIRVPAAFCGVVGFKPSMGRVPVFPPAPVGPLNQIGPITRNAGDARAALAVMAGPDERDIYSLPRGMDVSALHRLEGLRIGWSENLGFMPIEPEIARICETAAKRFAGAGALLRPLGVALEDPRPAAAMYYECGIAMAATKAANWRDSIDPGLVPVVEKALTRTAIDFAAAQLFRGMFLAHFTEAMNDLDLLVTPVAPVEAFAADKNGPGSIDGTAVNPFDWLGLTAGFNLIGLPAASVPCGYTRAGLPVGLQIVGRRFADSLVLRAAEVFEETSVGCN